MDTAAYLDRTSILQIFWTSDGSAFAPESRSRWWSYIGQKEEGVQPWEWLAAVHPDDREQVKQQWEHAVASARMFTTQYRLRTPEGNEQVVSLLCVPLLTYGETVDEWISWVSKEKGLLFSAEPAIWPEMLMSEIVNEQAPFGVICFSPDRRIIQANEHFCQIVGRPCSELIGQLLQYLLPADAKTRINLNIRQMLMGHMQHVTYKTSYVRPDGQMLWLKVTAALTWHPQGFPLYFFAWIEDLSLQRRLEQEQVALMAREQAAQAAAQQAQQEKSALSSVLHTVFDTVMDGMIMYNPDGTVLRINEAARTLLGLGAEAECLGKSQQELLPDYQHYQVYDDALRPVPIEELSVRRMQRGEVVPKSRVANWLVRFPSGRELYLDVTITPLQDPQGHPTGLITIFRDVTERHHQERRVRQAFQMLSSLMEAMVHLPLQADQHTTEEHPAAASLPAIGQRLCEVIRQVLDYAVVGLFTVEGPQAAMRLVGISGLSQERVARLQQDLDHSTLADYLDAASIAQLQANQVVLRNLVTQPFVRRPTRGMHNLLLAPMQLEGQLVGAFGIDRPAKQGYTREDIELVKALAHMAALVLERVRLLHAWAKTHANELALQEANRRFDTFLSLASHELRTPLTGIGGSIQLSLRRLQGLAREEQMAPLLTSETMQRIRHPLEEAIQRVTAQDRMISDLLDVSRIRTGHLEMVMRPVNLMDIARHTLQDIQYLAPERPIAFYEPAEESIPIMADADRIGQVISNYLSNALKYSVQGQLVELRLTKEGTTARVSVRDHGPGLTPQEQQAIWERFYRVKGIEVQYGTGAGLGLGLYLCRTIIERHGGQVGVASKKGEGSTFWFTLSLTSERL